MKSRTFLLAIAIIVGCTVPARASYITHFTGRDIGGHILYTFTFCATRAGHLSFEDKIHTDRGFAPTYTATAEGYQRTGCAGWRSSFIDNFAAGVWQGWVNIYFHGQKYTSATYYFSVR